MPAQLAPLINFMAAPTPIRQLAHLIIIVCAWAISTGRPINSDVPTRGLFGDDSWRPMIGPRVTSEQHLIAFQYSAPMVLVQTWGGGGGLGARLDLPSQPTSSVRAAQSIRLRFLPPASPPASWPPSSVTPIHGCAAHHSTVPAPAVSPAKFYWQRTILM